ncbi:MAG TPA: biotin/lipoyl-containing protein [Gemmataceae bacterium]|jgi:pyruvate/2-oxoglutarate dehydrogenase complex dihydrolipoamide acyltransferase (E2) component|nr:biotin/lipoyl-containing protein [Gemmataceae bacterium]
MQTEVILPDLGGLSEPVLSIWFVEPGEHVFAGDKLVEVLLAGATFDVSSPVSGRLTSKLAWPNARLYAGQVLGLVEATDEAE